MYWAKHENVNQFFKGLVGNLGDFRTYLNEYIEKENLTHPKSWLLVWVDEKLKLLTWPDMLNPKTPKPQDEIFVQKDILFKRLTDFLAPQHIIYPIGVAEKKMQIVKQGEVPKIKITS